MRVQAELPLAHIVVLELTRMLPGAVLARQLLGPFIPSLGRTPPGPAPRLDEHRLPLPGDRPEEPE